MKGQNRKRPSGNIDNILKRGRFGLCNIPKKEVIASQKVMDVAKPKRKNEKQNFFMSNRQFIITDVSVINK